MENPFDEYILCTKILRKNTPEAREALENLGLSNQIVVEAILKAYEKWRKRGENAPQNTAGIELWSWFIGSLRDVLVPRSWSKSRQNGFETVISPGGKIQIMCTSGDENTGNPDLTPRMNSSKGPSYRRVIERNQQILLPKQFNRPNMQPNMFPYQCLTWVVLAHAGENGQLHAELSLPIRYERVNPKRVYDKTLSLFHTSGLEKIVEGDKAKRDIHIISYHTRIMLDVPSADTPGPKDKTTIIVPEWNVEIAKK